MIRPEDFEINPANFSQMRDLRVRVKDYPGYSPEYRQQALEVFRSMTEDELGKITSEEAAVELSSLQIMAKRKLGRIPSNPALVAHYLKLTRYQHLQAGGLSSFLHGRTAQFMSYYDFGAGILEVVDDVLHAEDEIRGDAEEKERAAAANFTDSVAVGAYLGERAATKRLADLLTEHPSGFELVDSVVEELRNETNPDNPRRRTRIHIDAPIALQGGVLAAGLYKAYYPVAAQLPKN